MLELEDRIRRDITSFLDPGTQLTVTNAGHRLTAAWMSRGEPKTADFAQNGSDISVFFEGINHTYRAFLSSPSMSDMLGLARMIMQSRRTDFFVETRAKSETLGGGEQPALDLLQNSISPNRQDATSVLFITGDAGAGKTEVLTHLVRQQAERYIKGEADFVYLYVNAQGRALARLDEALATEIQDLRASRLTYHVVPTLTRCGVMVPLIDGFDELLGVLGYEDAFSSLRRFLEDLDGTGSLIASARSTYYQQEFVARSGRAFSTNQRVEVEQISILPWGDREFREFTDLKYSAASAPSISHEDFRELMTEAFSTPENAALKSKPFFVSKTSDLILTGHTVGQDSLVDRLINGYIERERTEKLLDRNGSPLLAADQIERFVQLVSEEMWMAETRVLNGETIKILAELAFPSDVVSGETLNVVRERAPTMAFFSPASGRDRIEFEHQLFFSYFLANTIVRDVFAGPDALYALLSRAQLPEYAASFAAGRIYKKSLPLQNLLDICAQTGKRPSSRPNQIRENCGSIIVSSIEFNQTNQILPPGLKLDALVFAGETFQDIILNDAHLNDVTFQRGDLTNAKFIKCTANHVGLHEVVVDPMSTLLELEGLDLETDTFGLRVRDGEVTKQIFRPDTIRNVMIACGFRTNESSRLLSVNEETLDLLERVLRKFERSNMFWPTDQDNRQIYNHDDWRELERTMTEAKIVNLEPNLPHKGLPRRALKRNFLPHQVMDGETRASFGTDSISRFWALMRDRFPPKATITHA